MKARDTRHRTEKLPDRQADAEPTNPSDAGTQPTLAIRRAFIEFREAQSGLMKYDYGHFRVTSRTQKAWRALHTHQRKILDGILYFGSYKFLGWDEPGLLQYTEFALTRDVLIPLFG